MQKSSSNQSNSHHCLTFLLFIQIKSSIIQSIVLYTNKQSIIFGLGLNEFGHGRKYALSFTGE